MIKKGRLTEIVKELRAASKMHAGQADEISEHIDDMGPKVKDHTNTKCWDGHAPKPGEPKTKMSSTNPGVRVNNCS